jgi:hypothetical protein
LNRLIVEFYPAWCGFNRWRNATIWSNEGQPAMADYHPVLARAISGLKVDTAEAREALYGRAHKFLVEELRRRNPEITEMEIKRERTSLAKAISKIEMESLVIRSLAPRASTTDRPPDANIPDPSGIRGKRSMPTRDTDRSVKRQGLEAPDKSTQNITDYMSGLPGSLATMLFGMAFFAGITSFMAYFYLRVVSD